MDMKSAAEINQNEQKDEMCLAEPNLHVNVCTIVSEFSIFL